MVRISYLMFFLLIFFTACNESETKKNDNVFDKIKKEDTIVNNVEEEKTLKVDCEKQLLQYKSEGLYSDLLESKIDTFDLKFLPPYILRLIRNEIFAKYCFKFKSKDLQQYFSKFNWYKPYHNNVDSLLTPIDLFNIQIIKQFEEKNEYIPKEELFDLYLKNIKNAPEGMKIYFLQNSDMEVINSVGTHIFNETKEVKYILYEYFYGCDACPSSFYLIIFKNDGTIINTKYLGMFGDTENNDFFVKNYSDSVILGDIIATLKPEYKDSLEYDECNDEYYGKNYFYNYDTTFTKIYLLKNEDFEIKNPK